MNMSVLELGLIAGLASVLMVALLIMALAVRKSRLSATLDTQRIFEQLDLVRAELLLLADRMDSAAPAVPRVTERVSVVAAQVSNGHGSRGYEVATRLARGGATCEELISSCGLSRHEAELLLRINKAEAERNRNAEQNQGRNAGGRSRLSVVG